MGRFTDPHATTRYELSDGDWVELRNELSFEEQRRVESGGLVGRVEGGDMGVEVDWAAYGVARLVGWIADWSFTDNGTRVPVNRETVGRLSPATAEELDAVLTAHVERVGGVGGGTEGPS